MKGSLYSSGGRWHVSFYTAKGKIHKSFKDKESAEIFRAGLALKHHEGNLDHRDYRRDRPLSFGNQVEKWLETKRHKAAYIKYRQRMKHALDVWAARDTKDIKFSDIEDLLLALEDRGLSSYYRHQIRCTLSMFFLWFSKRERHPAPEFPHVEYHISYRKIVDKETQESVLAEVYRQTWDKNPRVYIAIRFLATYINARPNELCAVKEKDVDLQTGRILLTKTKTRKPKWIFLTPEDVDLLSTLPASFGELYLFRHLKGNGSAKPNGKFGKAYLYEVWSRAAKSLGIEGVSLYPGTRHSSAVALRKSYSPEAIKRATMHTTNKAFERYLQVQGDELREIYAATRKGAVLVPFPGVVEKTQDVESNGK